MTSYSIWSRARGANTLTANTAITAAANISLAGLGVVSGVFAARLLGPHGRGELAAIQTWPSFIATLAMLGMPEALVYFSARTPSEAGRYLGSAVVVAMVSSVPFMLVGYLLTPLMLHAQAPAIVRASHWYLLLVLIFASAGLLPNPLRGRSDFASWNLMRMMPNILLIVVLVVAWACSRAVPIFVAAGNLIALALLIFPFAAMVARRVPGPFTPDLNKLPSMLSYGLPCMMATLPQMLNFRLDQMLMAAMLPARDLGVYVVAVAWSGAVTPILNAVGSMILPSVASATATNREHAVSRLAAASRATSLLACLISAAVAASAPLAIVFFFGAPYGDAIPSTLVLAPAAGVLGINFTLQEGIRGLGRPYLVLRAEVIGLAVTAVALTVMLRPMGIFGAALASLGGYVAVMIVLLAGARSAAGASPATLLVPQWNEISSGLRHLRTLVRSLAPSVG